MTEQQQCLPGYAVAAMKRRPYRVRVFVKIEIGAKNQLLDPVYPLPSRPLRSKTLSYRKLPINHRMTACM